MLKQNVFPLFALLCMASVGGLLFGGVHLAAHAWATKQGGELAMYLIIIAMVNAWMCFQVVSILRKMARHNSDIQRLNDAIKKRESIN